LGSQDRYKQDLVRQTDYADDTYSNNGDDTHYCPIPYRIAPQEGSLLLSVTTTVLGSRFGRYLSKFFALHALAEKASRFFTPIAPTELEPDVL
jgi:hypothetical protein